MPETKIINSIDDIDGVGIYQREGYPYPKLTVDTQDDVFVVFVQGYGWLKTRDHGGHLITWKLLANLKHHLSRYAVESRYGLGSWHPMHEPRAIDARVGAIEKRRGGLYLPDWIRAKLLVALKGEPSPDRPGWFPVEAGPALNALRRLFEIYGSQPATRDYGLFVLHYEAETNNFFVSEPDSLTQS